MKFYDTLLGHPSPITPVSVWLQYKPPRNYPQSNMTLYSIYSMAIQAVQAAVESEPNMYKLLRLEHQPVCVM